MRCQFNIHGGDSCGMILRYQGVKRFYALEFGNGLAKIVKHYYDDVVTLAETPCTFVPDQLYPVVFSATGSKLSAAIGDTVLAAEDDTLRDGGCGFHATLALCGVRELEVEAETCCSESI